MRDERSSQSAFTLIEMMVVMLIIGILSVFAYPSYRQARLKTARAEGRAALMRLMQQQERYYTQQQRYHSFSGGEDAPFIRFSGATEQTSAYLLDAMPCAGSSDAQDCILLQATPSNGLNDSHCGVLTLDSTGEQGATGSGTGSDSASTGNTDRPNRCW